MGEALASLRGRDARGGEVDRQFLEAAEEHDLMRELPAADVGDEVPDEVEAEGLQARHPLQEGAGPWGSVYAYIFFHT